MLGLIVLRCATSIICSSFNWVLYASIYSFLNYRTYPVFLPSYCNYRKASSSSYPEHEDQLEWMIRKVNASREPKYEGISESTRVFVP